MVRKRSRTDLRISLMREGIMRWETQAEPDKGQGKAGYLWAVSKPRYHPPSALPP